MTECPVVETVHGKVKGRACPLAKAQEAKQVFRYSRIPFAKPPVGDLRFEPPEKCDSWDSVKECTEPEPIPMQVHELGHQFSSYLPDIREFESDMDASVNEDCLYLRVYTASPSNAANMPVMVWFYGGGYQFGESGFYPGQVLCGLHDVVLVVPNYRVNVFGFLSLGKATSYSGNVGMLDQLMALRWVQDNIKNFGGNSDNVTIFGESAGATSVALHLLSPLSKGLFHKAIQHSGTVRLPGLVKEDNSVVLKMFLQHLKIAETDPEAIVQKLKSLPAQEVAEAAVKGLAVGITFLLHSKYMYSQCC